MKSTTTNNKIWVCLSGGIDSAALCIMAGDNLCGGVFVDYGQPSRHQERTAAGSVCATFDVPLITVQISNLDLGAMETTSGACIVPHRNAMLLAIAANKTPSNAELWIGCNANDQEMYSDCRPQFLQQISSILNRAIHAPLLDTSKTDIIKLVRKSGIESMTWSCYKGGATQCGQCNSCLERDSGDTQ